MAPNLLFSMSLLPRFAIESPPIENEQIDKPANLGKTTRARTAIGRAGTFLLQFATQQ
jgi:hypothetical protein